MSVFITATDIVVGTCVSSVLRIFYVCIHSIMFLCYDFKKIHLHGKRLSFASLDVVTSSSAAFFNFLFTLSSAYRCSVVFFKSANISFHYFHTNSCYLVHYLLLSYRWLTSATLLTTHTHLSAKTQSSPISHVLPFSHKYHTYILIEYPFVLFNCALWKMEITLVPFWNIFSSFCYLLWTAKHRRSQKF